MSITFHTETEHNLIILVHTGTTPDDEFLAFYKGLYGSDTFDLSMNLLVDLREADSSERSADVLHEFADFVRAAHNSLTTHPKVAVVAPKDLSFGLARMYEAFTDSVPWDFTVFRVIEAALAWLGMPEDLAVRHDQEAQQRPQGDN
jgi:hypothetical protein